jgi:hypothetical protein
MQPFQQLGAIFRPRKHPAEAPEEETTYLHMPISVCSQQFVRRYGGYTDLSRSETGGF